MNRDDVKQVEGYLDADDEYLLESLGEYLYPPILGVNKPKNTDYIKFSLKWIEKNKNKICNEIKNNEFINNYIKEGDNYKRAEIIAVLIDGVLAATGISTIPVIILSALIIKQGIKEFCGI